MLTRRKLHLRQIALFRHMRLRNVLRRQLKKYLAASRMKRKLKALQPKKKDTPAPTGEEALVSCSP